MAATRPAPLRIADLPPEFRARSAALAATFPDPPPGVIARIAPVLRPVLRQIAERQQQQEAGAA